MRRWPKSRRRRQARRPSRRRAAPMPGPDLSASPLYIDAGDRRVQVLQTMRHPRVVVFGDLVSDEECEALIAAARLRLARSLTVETQTGGEALNVDRTSDGMFFERGENAVVARLEQRIATLLQLAARVRRGPADPALRARRRNTGRTTTTSIPASPARRPSCGAAASAWPRW